MLMLKNFENEGSGPGLSLLYCKNYLNEPFYYMPCDCILHTESKKSTKNKLDRNYKKFPMTESISYCNLKIEKWHSSPIFEIKQISNSNYVAFSAPLFIKDHKIFWEGLKNNKKIKNEHQISNGIISSYLKNLHLLQ